MTTYYVQYLATASSVVKVEAEDESEARDLADAEFTHPQSCAQCAGMGPQPGFDLGEWYSDDSKFGVWAE